MPGGGDAVNDATSVRHPVRGASFTELDGNGIGDPVYATVEVVFAPFLDA